MTFAETGLKRIDQTLPHVCPHRQPIDQCEYIFEVLALVIIRRSQINLPAFVQQPREAALHQAHEVSSDRLTGRRGEPATGRSFFRFPSVSPSPRLPVSVSVRLGQPRRRRKQDEESRSFF